MHLTKYTEGWTRRHFLEQVSKRVFAAGVLSPLMDVIGRNGNCEAAYPPELLSIEAYTRGELKAGDVLSAENVDIVKDLLDPGAYWQIKHDGRLVDLAPTETDLARLMPTAYLQATLANTGKHKIFPDGNVYTLDGKPWIGGNPFSQPQSAAEILWANTLSWGKYDSQAHPVLDFDTDADGNVEYQYASYFVEWQTVGRLTLDPRPYMRGRESQLRILGGTVLAPADISGTGVLQMWAYDQHKLPVYYLYQPRIRSVRAYPADQRFEPQFPGNTFFVTEYHMAGDPLLTWGNFKLVGKGPLLAGASHCADLDQPNWMHKTCGGKSGAKYWRTRMELVPEMYVVEMEPTSYPRAPIGKKRIWFDGRTLYPMTMISYDRQGRIWKQWEGGSDYYERKPGMKWFEGTPDHFVSWSHVHAHDLQSNRMSRFYCAQTVPGGYHATVDDPSLFDNFCTMEALERSQVRN
jgi:Protein of unknown function (DUF1329)